MTVHALEPDDRTLHDHFSRDLDPVLEIEPGDSVVFQTLDAGWHREPVREPPRMPRTGRRGHALVGPVAVRGATPGSALEVEIVDLRPGSWGWTRSGGAPSELHKRFGVDEGDPEWLLWSIDARAGQARNRQGHTVAIRPFLGVMGLAPAAPGFHETGPPRAVGGNMDCAELLAGTTLFLPVEVEGALFSCGDGHARQGDGEVSGTAIECPMERAELRFGVRRDLSITAPRARLADAWLTIGVGPTLDESPAARWRPCSTSCRTSSTSRARRRWAWRAWWSTCA
ncbi:MAG TPA: acetamidase/formamidase family protein [Candidatus Dormibacteraeota bacterium]